jgi:hypothetical protein
VVQRSTGSANNEGWFAERMSLNPPASLATKATSSAHCLDECHLRIGFACRGKSRIIRCCSVRCDVRDPIVFGVRLKLAPSKLLYRHQLARKSGRSLREARTLDSRTSLHMRDTQHLLLLLHIYITGCLGVRPTELVPRLGSRCLLLLCRQMLDGQGFSLHQLRFTVILSDRHYRPLALIKTNAVLSVSDCWKCIKPSLINKCRKGHKAAYGCGLRPLRTTCCYALFSFFRICRKGDIHVGVVV